jgi:hypothetical protein
VGEQEQLLLRVSFQGLLKSILGHILMWLGQLMALEKPKPLEEDLFHF